MSAAQPTLARDVLRGPALSPISPRPSQPTLIRPLPEKPLQAARLEDLARHIHRLRGNRGLRLGGLSQASHGGRDTFPGFNVFVIDAATQAESWIGFAAVQSDRPDALQAAIRMTEPA